MNEFVHSLITILRLKISFYRILYSNGYIIVQKNHTEKLLQNVDTDLSLVIR